MAALGWLLNLGFAAGAAVVAETADVHTAIKGIESHRHAVRGIENETTEIKGDM